MPSPSPSSSSSRFPFPIPLGWFGLSRSKDLAVGKVQKIRFCGRDLAVFRGEDGRVGALNNYCPHLGAALHQGEVIGNSVRCPFHHWQFNCEGQCTGIPYAKSIPPQAKTDIVPVLERNGMVLGWHHPKGEPPSFEVPVVESMDGQRRGWGELHYFEVDLPTCVQEIAENDVDSAHFVYVHGASAQPDTQTETDGHWKRSVSTFNQKDLNDEIGEHTGARPDPDVDTSYTLTSVAHGCGHVTVHSTGVHSMSTGEVGECMLYNVATPIEDDLTRLRWTLAVTENLADDEVGQGMLEGLIDGVQHDIPIWREKRYQPKPLLCDGDGAIAKNRKWFQQFYVQ